MALSDYSFQPSDVDCMLDRYYAAGAKPQFMRVGATARWFKPRSVMMKGKSYEFKAFTQPATGVRRERFATAATSAFPVPRKFAYENLSVIWDDLIAFRCTPAYNILTDIKTAADQKLAVEQLVSKIITESDNDFGGQLNDSLHQSGTSAMALVHTIYDVDGSSFDGAAGYAAAFIRIKSGSITQFHKGEVLDIYDVSNGTTLNATVKVLDVITGEYGPWTTSGTRVASIGPGIVVQNCAATGVVGTVAWNTPGAEPAAGDYIARSGEFAIAAASYRNIHGFPDWFDTTVDIYRAVDGGALKDRHTAGNAWMNPDVVYAAAAGSEEAFDPDVHLREIEDTLYQRIAIGRKGRQSVIGDAPEMTDALVAICKPAILNDVVDNARDSQRFTHTSAMNLSEAKAKKLFAVQGFEGYVYHSPTLGTVAMQSDPSCRPNVVEIADPNAFFYLTAGDHAGSVSYVPTGGNGRWASVQDPSTGLPTFEMQAGMYTLLALMCDQPGAIVEIQGVKSSRE